MIGRAREVAGVVRLELEPDRDRDVAKLVFECATDLLIRVDNHLSGFLERILHGLDLRRSDLLGLHGSNTLFLEGPALIEPPLGDSLGRSPILGSLFRSGFVGRGSLRGLDGNALHDGRPVKRSSSSSRSELRGVNRFGPEIIDVRLQRVLANLIECADAVGVEFRYVAPELGRVVIRKDYEVARG